MKPYKDRLHIILPSAKKASLGLRQMGDFLSKSGWSLVNKEQEMEELNWYERGELPPIGTVCELIWCGVPQGDVEIIAYRDNDSKVIFWHFKRDNVLAAEITTTEFRPIRTETDKLVDEALETLKSDYVTHLSLSDLDLRMCAEVMVEAGYRKVKPIDRDEFVRDALKYFEFEVSQLTLVCDSLRKLHSVGCRFIDKGGNDE